MIRLEGLFPNSCPGDSISDSGFLSSQDIKVMPAAMSALWRINSRRDYSDMGIYHSLD